ncbi:MAG TPA: prepilin peptidase [Tepidisphaeraceae bacterium]|nr:prepilin peptidase [Tepidisphaeraceae bacterium]
MPLIAYAIFFFLVGACIGSFLNVVVWRLPRGESLITPPSHCPKCDKQLAWFDNVPIVGWLALRGRCRYCKEPISPRYPIVEAITAALFVLYFLAYYLLQMRTCCPQPRGVDVGDQQPMIVHVGLWILGESWPIYVLYMITIAGLLAASLIDAELFIIPTQIPYVIAGLAFLVHAIADRPWIPGSLNLVGGFGATAAALSAGAAVGLLISLALWWLKILPTSFPQGEPLLDVDRAAIEEEIAEAKKRGEHIEYEPLPPPMAKAEILGEIRKEILFLMPPLALGAAWMTLTMVVPTLRDAWANQMRYDWLTGLLGSLLGALVGAFVVWLTRILGTLAFRRVAMGLGDVHLMFGVGAVIGAAGATIAFFIAPFFGILIAIYMMITRKGREMPLGPYLSLATAFVMLFYCPIAAYLTPGLQGMLLVLGGLLGHHGG